MGACPPLPPPIARPPDLQTARSEDETKRRGRQLRRPHLVSNSYGRSAYVTAAAHKPVRADAGPCARSWPIDGRWLLVKITFFVSSAFVALGHHRIAGPIVAGKLRIGAERPLHGDTRLRGISEIFRGDDRLWRDAAFDPLH